ncbi:hypothetical protein [Pseudidiomarina insulisalsae]|uniref:hypothetical protein n=1 Tax=Pseudidiomarina insulisalsae TaxID=575789 RepID=UPI000F89CF64|nr:hypothetical protein [Pseudidiomarina insulisalsae]
MVLGEAHSFPVSISAVDVNVIDARLSKYWVYGQNPNEQWSALISFPEWANDPFYYQNLVEGKGSAGHIFRRYEELLQNEHAPPNLEGFANLIKDNWYQCPICEKAWESKGGSEVITCPGCNEKLRRP